MCLCKGNSMKRKQLIAVSILSICLFASACGSNTTDTETIAVVQNTETQQAEIETENEVTESKSDEVKGDTETTEGGTSEATNSEGLTVDEASQADYEYMEEEIYKYYEGDIDTQMAAVKKDYGIDSLCGAWFIYCNGVQREHNKKLNNGLPILHKVPPKRDYGRYFCIMAEKGGTSHGGLTEKLSLFFHAKKQEVNAYGR